MQLIKIIVCFSLFTSTIFGVIFPHFISLSELNKRNNVLVNDSDVEQIISSYIEEKAINIKPGTAEYSLFMKEIMLGEHHELTRINVASLKSPDIRDAIFSYAWKHTAPLFENTPIDPRVHPSETHHPSLRFITEIFQPLWSCPPCRKGEIMPFNTLIYGVSKVQLYEILIILILEVMIVQTLLVKQCTLLSTQWSEVEMDANRK